MMQKKGLMLSKCMSQCLHQYRQSDKDVTSLISYKKVIVFQHCLRMQKAGKNKKEGKEGEI